MVYGRVQHYRLRGTQRQCAIYVHIGKSAPPHLEYGMGTVAGGFDVGDSLLAPCNHHAAHRERFMWALFLLLLIQIFCLIGLFDYSKVNAVTIKHWCDDP